MLNRSFKSEIFPDSWKDCTIELVFKKSDKFSPDNYRITLIDTFFKVLAKVLADRL